MESCQVHCRSITIYTSDVYSDWKVAGEIFWAVLVAAINKVYTNKATTQIDLTVKQ